MNVDSVNETGNSLVKSAQIRVKYIRNCGNHTINGSGGLTSVPVFLNRRQLVVSENAVDVVQAPNVSKHLVMEHFTSLC
jgi:hypothetical protein